MALERRGNNQYWYKSVRRGGRVVKEYGGGGELAQLIAELEQATRLSNQSIEKQRRLLEAETFRLLRSQYEPIDAYLDFTYDLVALHLMIGGYHQPKRGVWRKRRNYTMAKSPMQVWEPKDDKAVRAFIMHAQEPGTPSDVRDKAIALLQSDKWETTAGLCSDVDTVLRRMAGGDRLREEIMFAEYRREFSRFSGKPCTLQNQDKLPYLERIMIDRVIACQLALTEAERNSDPAKGHRSFEFWEKIVSQRHRRLISAVKALAEVRRLGVPQVNVAMPGATQVNVGNQQVNATMGAV